MGLTMIAILLVLSSLLLFGASPYGQEELIPFYSLALFPSLVSWGCLLVLIRYISTSHADGIDDTPVMTVAAATAQGLASSRSTTPAKATSNISQGVLGESADMAMNDNERRGLTVEQIQDALARLKSSSLH